MGCTPYGYYIEGGNAILDAGQATQVRNLFSDYVAGGSLALIAPKNQIPRTHSSIGNMLADARYIGDNYYPAIVEKELWEKVQVERRRRSAALGRDKNTLAADRPCISSFLGVIYCDACGSEFRRYAGSGHDYLRCSRYIVKKKVTCRSPMLTEAVLESAILEMLGNIDVQEISKKPKQPSLKVEQVFSDPFKQTEYAYSICRVDDFDYMTAKLITALADRPAGFDGGFMRSVIRKITLAHDGTIQFELINHKIIRGETKTNSSQKRIRHTGHTQSWM